jgi:hypothetical protein
VHERGRRQRGSCDTGNALPEVLGIDYISIHCVTKQY